MSTILIIEDNRNQRTLYEQELEEAELGEIITASTGSQGWELFTRYRPALTILDVLLPDTDGIVLMEKLLVCDPNAAIIVHSAFSSPSHEFISWYARAYVMKSGNLQELIRQAALALADPTVPDAMVADKSQNWKPSPCDARTDESVVTLKDF